MAILKPLAEPAPIAPTPQWRLSPNVRCLIGCELGFNVGFYLLLPLVAGELHGRGLSAAVVGLVLGTRTLSHQGLFPVGGWLADRIGSRSTIIAGCFVRAAGFLLFAASSRVSVLIAAALLTGLGGALFTPALRSSLASGAKEVRARAFAQAARASQVGALVGPLFGLVLLRAGFATVAFIAALVFFVAGLVLLVILPTAVSTAPLTEAGPTRRVAPWRNRRFLAFVAAMSGYAILFNQLYVVLPLALVDVTGARSAGAWLFAITATVVLLFQSRTTMMCARRWPRFEATGRGLAVMGWAFLPCAALALIGARRPTALPLVAAAVLVTTVILAVGMMIAYPFAMDLVSVLAGEQALGRHYGIYYCAGGLAATAGSTLAGAVYERTQGTPGVALLWAAFATLGVASGAAVRAIGRRSQLAAVS